ncbi:FumA C-terminus/TtdB family hydratase beta subunit [Clostridium formicaceticum]|uniref:Fumarate hydratase n=1 Tax=Clostridium formicaceticum TaxID=1497 RepID=A0AAC9RHQ2_9CLOT|nr:FumA C-terminus/TtdB family hydratase beta subunit [Clostridium formicaceticum]AOY75425.1 fumarate hydratase [Clostridium formicaceticum]ARE85705.1 Fumarate hydratase class I, aerobic [Clostridium formicaceticum]
MKVQLPFTKDLIEKLNIGEVLELTGYIYTARDAAHQRMVETLKKGEKLPINLQEETIFYAGPCPAPPKHAIGAVGPTTSARMDPYVEDLLKEGLIAMIGKGDRSSYIPPLMKKYKVIYLLGIGGAAAITARQVKSVEEIAYQDLGPESIKKLYVEDLKVIVGIDTKGKVLSEENIRKYKK